MVDGYNKNLKRFHITYTDGDWEEFNAKEVKDHLSPTQLHIPSEDEASDEERDDEQTATSHYEQARITEEEDFEEDTAPAHGGAHP